jgi:mRNA-degrading endonuclease RelE of RelBE toxin-antitoxin system
MEFRIADTFTDSLAKLTGEEQKAVKTTAFDLQMNPVNPGMQLHKLERAKDPNFWSARVNQDIRLIVHKTAASFLLCYVDHHDSAYDWALRRRLETHPKTGAAQLVVVRETVQEVIIPKYIEVEQPKPLLFAKLSDDELLSYGVPAEWLNDVRQVNEDSLLTLAEHLPGEAAEALLELATGGKPQVAQASTKGANPFEHPDALRRFRVMNDYEELARALEFPWEKWTIFLHPAQRQLVERDFSGPARVAGSAGTGKTVVALHRAAHLARHNRQARVLLTTFSNTLAKALDTKLRRLLHHEPRLAENIEVYSLHAIGRRLYKARIGAPRLASDKEIQTMLAEASQRVAGHKFSLRFLRSEWEEIVDAWQLESWEAYRDVKRLGRKTRLPEAQRTLLWAVFERVRAQLKRDGLLTDAALFTRLAAQLTESGQLPFDFAVVDEAQDVSIPQLRFLAALGGSQSNGLFFAGDLGQRIFQQPFSWKVLGVDIRGRSRILNINYRTSHQIRQQADRLLGPEVSDVDGNTEKRDDTISIFNGPIPALQVLTDIEAESKAVSTWLKDRIKEGKRPDEIGVFVRSEAQLERAKSAVEAAGLKFKILDENVGTTSGFVSLSTMHLAKGLEFRAVVVMACDDEIVPLQERIETVADDTELEEIYNTERHLLYVACTRARDQLLVTSVTPASEFLDDLGRMS